VQQALRAAGIEYEKVTAGHGHPIPFLRKGSREELREATGDTKLPALKLPDGTIITHSRAIPVLDLTAELIRGRRGAPARPPAKRALDDRGRERRNSCLRRPLLLPMEGVA
jgi:hypothetical protein